MSKEFAHHCEKNKQPILNQLKVYFKSSRHVLEIGSGTGQHAVFFAEQLPHLVWHTSDVPETHASVKAWIAESRLENVVAPVNFTIGQDSWPEPKVDTVFTANTTHIMQPEESRLMMELVAANLPEGGIFCQYGAMNVNGQYTSESNRNFDQTLREQGYGGIRSIEELECWAKGMQLVERVPMPSNNFLLVWKGLR